MTAFIEINKVEFKRVSGQIVEFLCDARGRDGRDGWVVLRCFRRWIGLMFSFCNTTARYTAVCITAAVIL
jgi:hypothetical protein